MISPGHVPVCEANLFGNCTVLYHSSDIDVPLPLQKFRNSQVSLSILIPVCHGHQRTGGESFASQALSGDAASPELVQVKFNVFSLPDSFVRLPARKTGSPVRIRDIVSTNQLSRKSW